MLICRGWVQLRGIDKRIAALKAEINYATTSDRQQFIAGLAALEAEKALLAQGIVGSVGDGSDSDHGESAEPASPRPEDKDGTGQDTPPQKHASMDIDEQSDCDSEGEEVVETRTADGHGAAGIAITERELRQHFHLPLHTAAQKFGICTTAFKKLCRRFKIAKWPHRQVPLPSNRDLWRVACVPRMGSPGSVHVSPPRPSQENPCDQFLIWTGSLFGLDKNPCDQPLICLGAVCGF